MYKLLSTLSLLLIVGSLSAQDLSSVVVDGNHLTPTEKIYIHQDRTRYMAGETMWFKAYQSFSTGLQDGSGVVYVDLIDGSNNPVIQTKWKLDDGMAAGSIALPDTLPTGNYQLRAYTRWMQNFETESIFKREITISSLYISEQYVPLNFENKLTLLPEGGHLVDGLPSRIAFMATDAHGKGINTKGVVMDSEEHLIQQFETKYDGMGYFYFVPEKSKTYIARLEGSDMTVPFPEIQQQGVVLSTYVFSDQFRITLKHNTTNYKTLNLMIHRDDQIYFNSQIAIEQETVVADIPVSRLPAGIFTLTISDDTGHAWCERLCMVNYPEPLYLKTTIDKDTYHNRDQITLNIEATDAEGNPQAGNFSLAVVKANLDNTLERNNFYTDFLLQSELRGTIDNPGFYLDSANSRLLDLLLMTHGWRRYSWDDRDMGIQPSLYFAVEKALNFSGKVELRNAKQSADNVQLTAYFRHDSINEVIASQPGPGGFFRFDGFDFTDTVEVILSAKDNRQTLDLSIITHPNPQPTYYSSNQTISQEENEDLLVEAFGEMPNMTGDMENTIYELPEVQVSARVIRPGLTRQRHSSVFNVTAYEMNENFSYTPFGGTDSETGGALAILAHLGHIPGVGAATYGFSNVAMGPIFVLGGSRVSAVLLAATPASMIARVEILTPTAAMIYGNDAAGGAIAFFTKELGVSNNSIPTQTVYYKFPGYNQEKEFYSPDYAVPQPNYRPDYRKTLYWQPDVVLDQDGKASFSFFTSDDTGEYTIHCEGISTTNEIGVGLRSFKVTN